MVSKLRIGFILDPVEQLVLEEDTSLLLLNECRSRGHQVFYIHQEDIFWSDGTIMVNLSYAEFDKRFNPVRSEKRIEQMNSLDVVFMRLEPPYNLNYFYITHLLQLIGGDTLVINNPMGLRDVNEKLYSLKFPEVIPETVVTKDINILKSFLKKSGKIIIKQLNMYASKELVVVSDSEKDVFQIFDKATESKSRYVLAQKFLDDLYRTGDKRAVILSGKVIGCYARIPKKNDFRSDPDFGGVNRRTELSKKEKEICSVISQKLLEDGIYFAGIDLIGEKLTEVNVTCPAGIIPINKLYRRKLEKEIIDFIEGKILERS